MKATMDFNHCALVGCSQATPQPTPKPAATKGAQPAAQPAAPVAAQPTAAPAAKKAEDWPTKPINIIVPFDSGGSVDRMARNLATYLSQELKVPVTAENKPGASGQLGHTAFLQAPDDGYTLLVSPAMPYIANNILQTNAKFKMSDFAFINAQWTDWLLVQIHKDKPYKTMGDLIEQIKKTPKKVSAGVTFGSAGHLATLVILDSLKLPSDSINFVTYDGGGPLRTAIAGGQVDFSINGAEGTDAIRDMTRALAVFLEKRDGAWDAPPISEAMQPYGITVPLISGSVRVLAAQQTFKQKYPDRWDKLVQAYQRTLERPDYKEWLQKNSMGGDWLGPDKTTRLLNDNFAMLEKYKDLLKQ